MTQDADIVKAAIIMLIVFLVWFGGYALLTVKSDLRDEDPDTMGAVLWPVFGSIRFLRWFLYDFTPALVARMMEEATGRRKVG